MSKSENIMEKYEPLRQMAFYAGIENALFAPRSIADKMKHLIWHLEAGIRQLTEYPNYYDTFIPEGSVYDREDLIHLAKGFLLACQEYPEMEFAPIKDYIA